MKFVIIRRPRCPSNVLLPLWCTATWAQFMARQRAHTIRGDAGYILQPERSVSSIPSTAKGIKVHFYLSWLKIIWNKLKLPYISKESRRFLAYFIRLCISYQDKMLLFPFYFVLLKDPFLFFSFLFFSFLFFSKNRSIYYLICVERWLSGDGS